MTQQSDPHNVKHDPQAEQVAASIAAAHEARTLIGFLARIVAQHHGGEVAFRADAPMPSSMRFQWDSHDDGTVVFRVLVAEDDATPVPAPPERAARPKLELIRPRVVLPGRN